SDLDGCIVNLLPSAVQHDNSSGGHQLGLSALHIRNVTGTVMLLPVIQGSVILHDLTRCVIVVGCHQVGLPSFLPSFCIRYIVLMSLIKVSVTDFGQCHL